MHKAWICVLGNAGDQQSSPLTSISQNDAGVGLRTGRMFAATSSELLDGPTPALALAPAPAPAPAPGVCRSNGFISSGEAEGLVEGTIVVTCFTAAAPPPPTPPPSPNRGELSREEN